MLTRTAHIAPKIPYFLLPILVMTSDIVGQQKSGSGRVQVSLLGFKSGLGYNFRFLSGLGKNTQVFSVFWYSGFKSFVENVPKIHIKAKILAFFKRKNSKKDFRIHFSPLKAEKVRKIILKILKKIFLKISLTFFNVCSDFYSNIL